jgi:hypothetical protein
MTAASWNTIMGELAENPTFVALLRIFYQILNSYCKFIMPKALK